MKIIKNILLKGSMTPENLQTNRWIQSRLREESQPHREQSYMDEEISNMDEEVNDAEEKLSKEIVFERKLSRNVVN